MKTAVGRETKLLTFALAALLLLPRLAWVALRRRPAPAVVETPDPAGV